MLDVGLPERRANRFWPNLTADNCDPTSESDPYYNCVAWAMRDKHHWWEPSGRPQHYWPNKATPDYSLDSYLQAFATRHYVVCNDGELEAGFEKIAIYLKDGDFEHIARQLPNGHWTSKLGEKKDVTHHALDDLSGDYYGEPSRFMRRPRAQTPTRPRRTRARQRRTRS